MSRDHAAILRPLLARISGNPDLPRSARLAAADAEAAQDVEAVASRTAAAIVAVEASMATMESASRDLRAALLALLVDEGFPTLSIGTHTIGYSEPRRVRITDAGAIPPDYLDQPPPKPNTQAIGAALRAGAIIPGAELSNGEPTLFIRAKKP
jgi:hypothetical protein